MTPRNVFNFLIGSPSEVEQYAIITIDCITNWDIIARLLPSL